MRWAEEVEKTSPVKAVPAGGPAAQNATPPAKASRWAEASHGARKAGAATPGKQARPPVAAQASAWKEKHEEEEDCNTYPPPG